MNKITNEQLDSLIKSAVNSSGPLPPDDKFLQIISALRELRELRAAMLQGAEPVTTAYKLPFEQWLSQQTGTIDAECGCVMTEVFFHWLRVAYEAGNSQTNELSMVSHPVHQVFSFKRWRDVNEEVFEEEKRDGCQVRVLYTAPTNSALSDDWIPCGEMMPDEGQEVIVMDVIRGKVQSGILYKHGKFIDFNEEYYEVENPSHWMPLPAAPKQEG
ncbi:TPA: DUF551 domain-containing protein [Enterobacter hormaechei subsp. steigerwaltii]|nr:DUF551 domain-containing protein [Enterobacter hormaechei subsp. steigerwaltii]